MAQIRSFISVEIPQTVRSCLYDAQAVFHQLNRHIRWVRPESIHLTLIFLGNIETEDVDPVSRCVQEAVEENGPFDIKVKGAGVFPNQRLPSVLWMGLTEGVEQLSELQEKLREGLSELGFKLESRKFRPHLTLGRFRDGRKAGKVLDEEMFKRVGTLEANFTADRVNLMQSRLNPSGAIYTVLKEHRLSG